MTISAWNLWKSKDVMREVCNDTGIQYLEFHRKPRRSNHGGYRE